MPRANREKGAVIVTVAFTLLFLMGFMAIGTGLLCVAVTTISLAWPVAMIGLIGIAFATMSASWNGVYLAEVARQAPDGQVAPVTACGMICLWCGSLLGAPV